MNLIAKVPLIYYMIWRRNFLALFRMNINKLILLPHICIAPLRSKIPGGFKENCFMIAKAMREF